MGKDTKITKAKFLPAIKEQQNPSAKTVLSKGCFNLRNWESNVNGPGVSKCTGDTDLLGIIWNLDRDTLRCSVINEIPQNKGNTRKEQFCHLCNSSTILLEFYLPPPYYQKFGSKKPRKLNWPGMTPYPQGCTTGFPDGYLK
ncbi:hypothetical protein TNCT_600661 [Trichonephila clavata]|uniref:Uncharacterized protein n=1 Tax=Trichonephila clavata TaxID=2740835 RepID=A0A8X6LKB5_TRICU|nr:hypothetical protein TNCT_600661 [Trichonephila clavata]